MMFFAQIFNEGVSCHVPSCPKISGSYGTCLAREIKMAGKGGGQTFGHNVVFSLQRQWNGQTKSSATNVKWEILKICCMRDWGEGNQYRIKKKNFMKKVKKSEKIFHLRYFIMDFYHFLTKCTCCKCTICKICFQDFFTFQIILNNSFFGQNCSIMHSLGYCIKEKCKLQKNVFLTFFEIP